MTVRDVLEDGGLLSNVIDNYKQRDGQIEMAEAIFDSYETHKTVLINAPTGNGKSIGCLVPAILNKRYGKTIISTATKALQSQYETKDIPMLHEIMEFNSHVLKGRDNYACRYKCNENIGIIPIDLRDKFKSWLNETQSGDLETLDFVLPHSLKSKVCSNVDDCVEEDCPYAKKCFYTRSKSLAMSADVLVVNHDLLSLFLMLKREKHISMFGDVYSVIVDEAHKLEDVMTKYLGFTLHVNSCKSFVKNVKSYCSKCVEKHLLSEEINEHLLFDCETIVHNMKILFSDFIQNDDVTYRLYSSNLNIDICKSIMDLIFSICHRLPNAYDEFNPQLDKKIIKKYETINKRAQNLKKIFDMLYNIGKNILDYCYYVESCEDINRIKLAIAPIDISSQMNEMLFERKVELEDGDIACVSLLSATLFVNKSFNFIKSRLGIQKMYSDSEQICLYEISVNEMFDYRHSCLLYVPKGLIEPSNVDGDRKVFTNQIIDAILELSDIVDGGILSLFTSYSEMDKCFDGVSGGTDRNVINQISTSRQKAISDFKEDEESIFFGTKTFWEGVDIQGRACSCVLIDRIPFPVPSDPIIEARIDKIKREDGNWFDSFYLPIAIIALQQGFGRLIRTHKDLGMVVLMDIRVVTKGYGSKIIRSLPDCLKTRDIEKVKLFWDVVRHKRALRNGDKNYGQERL